MEIQFKKSNKKNKAITTSHHEKNKNEKSSLENNNNNENAKDKSSKYSQSFNEDSSEQGRTGQIKCSANDVFQSLLERLNDNRPTNITDAIKEIKSFDYNLTTYMTLEDPKTTNIFSKEDLDRWVDMDGLSLIGDKSLFLPSAESIFTVNLGWKIEKMKPTSKYRISLGYLNTHLFGGKPVTIGIVLDKFQKEFFLTKREKFDEAVHKATVWRKWDFNPNFSGSSRGKNLKEKIKLNNSRSSQVPLYHFLKILELKLKKAMYEEPPSDFQLNFVMYTIGNKQNILLSNDDGDLLNVNKYITRESISQLVDISKIEKIYIDIAFNIDPQDKEKIILFSSIPNYASNSIFPKYFVKFIADYYSTVSSHESKVQANKFYEYFGQVVKSNFLKKQNFTSSTSDCDESLRDDLSNLHLNSSSDNINNANNANNDQLSSKKKKSHLNINSTSSNISHSRSLKNTKVLKKKKDNMHLFSGNELHQKSKDKKNTKDIDNFLTDDNNNRHSSLENKFNELNLENRDDDPKVNVSDIDQEENEDKFSFIPFNFDKQSEDDSYEDEDPTRKISIVFLKYYNNIKHLYYGNGNNLFHSSFFKNPSLMIENLKSISSIFGKQYYWSKENSAARCELTLTNSFKKSKCDASLVFEFIELLCEERKIFDFDNVYVVEKKTFLDFFLLG